MPTVFHRLPGGDVQEGTSASVSRRYAGPMLGTLIIVLVVLWALGLATAYTAGGLIHVLLVIAIIVVLIRVIQGRNPLKG